MTTHTQPHLLPDTTPTTADSPVTCLGRTFPNDQARRAYYTDLLREKLQDPAFRAIEGFPIGTDEAILALSDPPYYTACPNPWLGDFVAEWGESGIRNYELGMGEGGEDPQSPIENSKLKIENYHREPFAADVSEGKNDPIYNAHSYHTKVPHKAIMRYILHYTEPGDIVFDGFCGTGMTGVAAQLCGDRAAVESLGYRVSADGTILQATTDAAGKKGWTAFSRLGARRAVLNDLSPAATFIAYNYNTPVDVAAFEREAQRILREVEAECGWMYETAHSDGRTGTINYTVWSDVFVCPQCTTEVVFWEAAVDKQAGKVRDEFPCPHCGATLTKRNMDRAWVTRYDTAIDQTIRQAKQVPVLINYSLGKKRFEKAPDSADLALIEKIEGLEIPYWFPTDRMMEGKETRRNDPTGITHVHHFYMKGGLHELAAIWAKYVMLENRISKASLLSHTAASPYASKMRRFRPDKRGGGPLSGTLYISSLVTPPNPILTVGRNIDFVSDGLKLMSQVSGSSIICTNSGAELGYLKDSSLDYVFIDPPFGSNLNYSELNFLWEAWLRVLTNNEPEAIENTAQGKGLLEYYRLMVACFNEAYRVLKPGRWVTVEFSNTNASVWNVIQTALADAGFIVANVSALDKQQGSFKAVTTPTAVKQDLVISAYKPNGGFTERFPQEAQTENGVWDFIRTHLGYLPVIKEQQGQLQTIPERDPRLLYDQLVAYYVRHGYPVPLSSQEFQLGLAQRFSERDGMVFLPEQTVTYDGKRLSLGQTPLQAALPFVSDEASAIQWLRTVLKLKPQIFADINPQFMQQLGGWQKNEEQLDLRELLDQNFLRYDGSGLVPEQIHAYLSTNYHDLRNLPKDDPALRDKAKDRWYLPDPNKAADLEKLRERHLLREFETYRESKLRKLKVFRLEAMRAGFKRAWQERDYETIVTLANKIPDNVLQEDPKLLMWVDQANTRLGK